MNYSTIALFINLPNLLGDHTQYLDYQPSACQQAVTLMVQLWSPIFFP